MTGIDQVSGCATVLCHICLFLVDCLQAVGTLLTGIAATLQLPDDVIVAPGGGDNAMAALGIGAVDPGKMVMSLGTSGIMRQ